MTERVLRLVLPELRAELAAWVLVLPRARLLVVRLVLVA